MTMRQPHPSNTIMIRDNYTHQPYITVLGEIKGKGNLDLKQEGGNKELLYLGVGS